MAHVLWPPLVFFQYLKQPWGSLEKMMMIDDNDGNDDDDDRGRRGDAKWSTVSCFSSHSENIWVSSLISADSLWVVPKASCKSCVYSHTCALGPFLLNLWSQTHPWMFLYSVTFVLAFSLVLKHCLEQESALLTVAHRKLASSLNSVIALLLTTYSIPDQG